MNGSPLQSTRLEHVQRRLAQTVRSQLGDRWATTSATVLALLGGLFLGQNLSSFLLWKLSGGRPVVVLAMVLGHELVVRLRSRAVGDVPPLGWVLVDNLRMGVVFAFVLEAFKLGS